MANRRVLPLILAVALGLAVLVARLHRVQIVEGAIWRGEAASLVRTGAVRSYRRGTIHDAAGRPLARDETVYGIELCYRDFRRGHPLGQVAHARGALSGVQVPLSAALDQLAPWADELTSLTPSELERFALGGELATATLAVAPSDDPERDERRTRRADVRYYMARLLELDRAATRELAKLAREAPDLPWLDLAARARGQEAGALQARLHERLALCADDLDRLALALVGDGAIALDPAEAPRAALLRALEEWRASVEDGAADGLAREALGFAPARVEALPARADLRWLAAQLAWDESRLARWHAKSRETRLAQASTWDVERMLAEIELGALDGPLAQRTLRAWASAFASPSATAASEDWREWRELDVVDELARAFGAAPDDAGAAVLPFQDAATLGRDLDDPGDWRWLARAELWTPVEPHFDAARVDELALAWGLACEHGLDRDWWRERTRGVLASWEALFQAAIAERTESIAARRGGFPLALARERLDRAGERASFVLKDRGSRGLEVAGRPSYATVRLLERHAERFAGFTVVDAHERVRLTDERGAPIAGALVGDVRAPTLREALAEREQRVEFERLRKTSDRSEEESRELLWIARRLARPDEDRGRTGIEAYLDRELAGRNGYRELAGLQELVEQRARVDLAPEDGADVWLTLDAELQRAALETLAAPAADPDPALRDGRWLERPTGAIVLLSPEGDVLAAASYPDFERGEGEGALAPADLPYERCWRKPTFQPPGSVFKPFVAAWALDHATFDPRSPRDCRMLDDGQGAGYVDVRCNAFHGHGAVDLHAAIQRSCNSYFAWLGEHLTPEDWRGLAHEFGFGEPTGVRALGTRSGLLEDCVPRLFEREPVGREVRLAANGLAVVEATPMQIARATAALATGELPEVRLVARVGESDVERRARPLSISRESLEVVRRAMFACANESGGSAEPALAQRELGFRMCAKTGSGDIGTAAVEAGDGRQRVRKHTWVAGWFPPEEPRGVLVVFVHGTLATAGHSSVWLARQFLLRPEVRAWLAAQGVVQ